MTAFHCPTRERFLDRYEDIADHVAAHGYAVVDAWDSESSTLKEVSERFGSVQTHIRADANGLVGISTETVVNREWEKYRSEYSGLTSEEFLPHTDGSYLHGLVHRDGHYIQLLPPKMLVLQCWQSAVAGGASILIDVQRIYDDLATENPEQLAHPLDQGLRHLLPRRPNRDRPRRLRGVERRHYHAAVPLRRGRVSCGLGS